MLSPADLALAGAAALILFGPDKLPGLARQIGKVTREIQSTGQSFIREIERAGEETFGEREQRRIREQGMMPTPDYAATIASRPPKENDSVYNPIANDPAAESVPGASEAWHAKTAEMTAESPRLSQPPRPFVADDDLRD